ncbi:hypothetical protein [Psychrobacter sp. I-STPA6b]|uniref:hypothetical protein n=1 Tax=Psychrobacter sp. I-STPA6b TaxID=2585718 RepID=UPI001D0C796F|nr:hypothetical protein [Psychrobacter sp. I-STPA6b]
MSNLNKNKGLDFILKPIMILSLILIIILIYLKQYLLLTNRLITIGCLSLFVLYFYKTHSKLKTNLFTHEGDFIKKNIILNKWKSVITSTLFLILIILYLTIPTMINNIILNKYERVRVLNWSSNSNYKLGKEEEFIINLKKNRYKIAFLCQEVLDSAGYNSATFELTSSSGDVISSQLVHPKNPDRYFLRQDLKKYGISFDERFDRLHDFNNRKKYIWIFGPFTIKEDGEYLLNYHSKEMIEKTNKIKEKEYCKISGLLLISNIPDNQWYIYYKNTVLFSIFIVIINGFYIFYNILQIVKIYREVFGNNIYN